MSGHAWIRKHAVSAVLVATFCTFSFLAAASPAGALEAARPGEVEQMKVRGTFQASLDRAMEVGNHKVDSALVEKFRNKLEREYLRRKGFSPRRIDRIAPAPPPGRQGGLPSSGTPKIFALLIEFNDLTHSNSATDIDSMLFGAGDPARYPLESLTEYYSRASYGLLDLGGGSTLGWYQTAYDRSTIPETGAGREDLIKEVLNHYDGLGHDFSQYDNDGDGDIEYFIVIWAGPTGAWATFWWGWNLGWNDSSYTIDGKTLSNYSWQRESSSPSVVMHETGHSLGLPDLYDYDNTVGPGGGVGGFDMMDGNKADLNCFWKWMLDWTTPTIVAGSRQDLSLDDTATSGECAVVWPGATMADIFSEFYVVQNRQETGNDTGLWINPDGLAVWHVDTTLDGAGSNFAFNNSNTAHKLIRLMEADGGNDIETTPCSSGSTCSYAEGDDLYSDGDELGPSTTPSSDRYDGSDSCVRVWDIFDEGAAAGSNITAALSTVCNLPPVADADGPYSAECAGTSTTLTLDGTGSYDPDPGDVISYAWETSCPGGSFDDSTSTGPTLTVDTTFGCPVCDVTLTVTDLEGDSDSDSSSVTVSDTLDPVLACPSDVTLECDQATDTGSTGLGTATDVCDENPAVSFADVVTPGAVCPEDNYLITRTWTAGDACGNESTCDQSITVQDTMAPQISCNAPATIIPPDAPVSFTATATDNCSETAAEVLDFDCIKVARNGRVIDKTDSCEVEFSGDTVTILDSGGVGDHISWTVRSEDCTGNVSEAVCYVDVINPGHARH